MTLNSFFYLTIRITQRAKTRFISTTYEIVDHLILNSIKILRSQIGLI